MIDTFAVVCFHLRALLGHVLAFLLRRCLLSRHRAPMAGEMHVDAAWLTTLLRERALIGADATVALR